MLDWFTQYGELMIGAFVIALMLCGRAIGRVFRAKMSVLKHSAHSQADPMAEAEIYFAYGRKEEGIEILKETISVHPDRRKEFEARIAQAKDDTKAAPKAAKLFSPITRL